MVEYDAFGARLGDSRDGDGSVPASGARYVDRLGEDGKRRSLGDTREFGSLWRDSERRARLLGYLFDRLDERESVGLLRFRRTA